MRHTGPMPGFTVHGIRRTSRERRSPHRVRNRGAHSRQSLGYFRVGRLRRRDQRACFTRVDVTVVLASGTKRGDEARRRRGHGGFDGGVGAT